MPHFFRGSHMIIPAQRWYDLEDCQVLPQVSIYLKSSYVLSSNLDLTTSEQIIVACIGVLHWQCTGRRLWWHSWGQKHPESTSSSSDHSQSATSAVHMDKHQLFSSWTGWSYSLPGPKMRAAGGKLFPRLDQKADPVAKGGGATISWDLTFSELGIYEREVKGSLHLDLGLKGGPRILRKKPENFLQSQKIFA